MIPQVSTAKLIGFGIGLIAVLGFVFMALSWRAERDRLRDWQAVTLSAARDAAGNPKLLVRDVPQQVRELGDGLKRTTEALNRQSAAVDALGRRSAELVAEASRTASAARTRARTPERVSAGLEASSRSSERLRAPCEPSEALTEAWR